VAHGNLSSNPNLRGWQRKTTVIGSLQILDPIAEHFINQGFGLIDSAWPNI
jgi:hypothetical protein